MILIDVVWSSIWSSLSLVWPTENHARAHVWSSIRSGHCLVWPTTNHRPITRYGTGSLIFWSDWVDTFLGSGRKTVFSCLQLHYRKTQVLHAIMCRFLVSIYFDIGWLTDNYKNLLFKVRTSNMHPHAKSRCVGFSIVFFGHGLGVVKTPWQNQKKLRWSCDEDHWRQIIGRRRVMMTRDDSALIHSANWSFQRSFVVKTGCLRLWNWKSIFAFRVFSNARFQVFFFQVKSIPAHGGGITSLSWASAASPVVLATGACESQRSCWLLDPSRLWKKNIS